MWSRKMKLVIGLIATLFSFSICATSALSPIERKITNNVDIELENAKQLLKKAVNINSGTMNFSGVKAVGTLFIDELIMLGFDTKWIDGAAFNRSGHLLASKGNKGVKLLLIGHLDTVFANDSSFQTYEELPGNKVKGPGITDMKGGDVVMIYALKALKAAGVLDKFSVKIIMIGDEEKSGKPLSSSKKALKGAGKWADIALGFEDGDGNPETAVIARRGTQGWNLEVTAKPAHSSQIFREDIGYGAVLETARILNRFREELEKMHNLTFNPGLIVGGTDITLDKKSSSGTAFGKTNVIARSVKVAGGLRAMSAEQLTMAKKKMRDIIADNLSHTQATISFDEGYPAMSPRKSNYKLLGIYNQISKDLGFGEVRPVDPRRAGAADISFIAGDVTMAIDGLGLMGDGGHTDNETADMKTLPIQIKRAALLMHRLAK